MALFSLGSILAVLLSTGVRERTASSVPEQRLVIEPNFARAGISCFAIFLTDTDLFAFVVPDPDLLSGFAPEKTGWVK